MKILFVWLWAFWFAMINHISNEKNFKNHIIYWYEKDINVFEYLSKNRENPYFFNWVKLDDRIILLSDIVDILSDIDLIVLAIPSQFVGVFIENIKDRLKSWVIFLNLSKWIDNKTLLTVSDTIKNKLSNFLNYNYAVLSWWMIAREVIDNAILWATLSWDNEEILLKIKDIFVSDKLDIKIDFDYKNTELYGSLKNVVSIYIWYLEEKWYKKSSIWYYLVNIFSDLEKLIIILWWKKININSYDFLWDMIATCFWESRNRYLWILLAKWKNIDEAIQIMKSEKKHSEWYETILWIKDIILKNDLKFLKEIVAIFW